LVLIILLYYQIISIYSDKILSRTIPDGNPKYGINIKEYLPVRRIFFSYL